MRKLLLALFGKLFFKLDGKIEIKEQALFTQLNILVAEDSIKELEAQIAAQQSVLDANVHPRDEQEDLANKIADLQDQVKKIQAALAQHKQTLVNLDYKKQLLNRL